MTASRRRALTCACVAIACGISARASADTKLYLLAIGNNSAPPGRNAEIATLRYSDDDAAGMAELGAEMGARVTVLSVLDAPSQRRFPNIARDARAPTLVELRRAVAWHRRQFESDRRAGDDPVLILFYSGHGTLGGSGEPSLTMLDGPLTPTVLYDEVLAALPARYIHLLVDACHAEAVVRPRDLDAASVPTTPDEQRRVIERSSLARFPNVGAIIATASGAESHEWDAIEKGIFTHELLTAMRGAADVNHDGKVEYSEVTAFLNAANREVSDARAKLSVLVKTPALNTHASLTELSWAVRSARLEGSGRNTRGFSIEDDRGLRLADVRAEMGYRFSLILPTGRLIYVKSDAGSEARIEPVANESVAMDTIVWKPQTTRARGALETSLARGLFATPFGPTYYRGFVDANDDFGSVTFANQIGADPTEPTVTDARGGPNHVLAWASFGTAAALAGVAGTFSVLALNARSDISNASTERSASAAHDAFTRDRALAVGTGLGAAAALSVGLWSAFSGPARAASTAHVASAALALTGVEKTVMLRVNW